MEKSNNVPVSVPLKCIFIAMSIGFITGWIRYWIGYYVLIQGVFAGLVIPWLVEKSVQNQKEALSNNRFKIAALLFFSFMIAQALGFGLAQPVFDPVNWIFRIWYGQTAESVFGIFSTGGVVHQTFSEGLNGGFWAILWFIDILFMFFFMLVSLPLASNEKRS